VALNDLALALEDVAADYRVIGGHMVTRAITPSDLGAGERIRTAGLPFTRSVAQRSERTTCTDTTDWCRDDTHFTWFHN
jgi:hypothetical protein